MTHVPGTEHTLGAQARLTVIGSSHKGISVMILCLMQDWVNIFVVLSQAQGSDRLTVGTP